LRGFFKPSLTVTITVLLCQPTLLRAALLPLKVHTSDKKLQIIPLGGLGEFGMNCSLAVRYGDDIIVLDAHEFPDAELLASISSRPTSLILNRIRARPRLILTHGHEYHIGGIPFLLRR